MNKRIVSLLSMLLVSTALAAPADAAWHHHSQTINLTDDDGNSWTVKNGVVQENGKNAAFSFRVINLVNVNGTVYQENFKHLWWAWNGSDWVASSNPLTSSSAGTGASTGGTAAATAGSSTTSGKTSGSGSSSSSGGKSSSTGGTTTTATGGNTGGGLTGSTATGTITTTAAVKTGTGSGSTSSGSTTASSGGSSTPATATGGNGGALTTGSSAMVLPSCTSNAAVGTSNPTDPTSVGGNVDTVQCFINSIGVNQHLGWGDPSTGDYYNYSMEATELTYLGIHSVRDNPPASDVLGDFETMAQGGIHFTFPTGASGDYPSVVQQQLPNIEALNTAVPGSVFAIEGPNELNCQIVTMNGDPTSDPAAGVAAQKYLYSTVKGISSLSGVLVAENSTHTACGSDGDFQNYIQAEGNMDAEAQIGNWHVYDSQNPPANAMEQGAQYASELTPTEPMMVTEFGYTTPAWVSEATAGKYTLFGLADAFKDGIVTTYIYELMDNNTGDGNTEDNFGLFHTDGTPKPAATGIHNLVFILSQSNGEVTVPVGETVSTQSTPTVSGLSGSGRTFMLVNNQGGFDLLVWDESGSTGSVTVNLGSSYSQVNVYDPLSSQEPAQSLSNVSQVNIGMNGDLLVLTAVP